MAAQPGIHRLRPNHREWSPPQIICFDTETSRETTLAGELHTLRCWAARLDVRRSRTVSGLGSSEGYGFTVAELAEQIEIWAEGQRTVWLYAHNLSFDLAVTRLPAELHRRGWEVTAHAVSSDAPWLRMKRGSCVLTFCDSWGWLRAPLDHIGADVGYRKPDLPEWDDTDDAWVGRARADVTILALAMLALMDWWDSEQLGSWTLTGSAGGWNCWRHKTTADLPLIVPDPAQCAFDRRAIYGGRREAFAHGEQSGGPWVLADFTSAYPTVAATYPLPAARQGNFASLPVNSPLICSDTHGIIAEVTVQTDVPRWPVRVAGRVAYPVGRFKTVLAGPEILAARDAGALVAIGPGWLHKLSPHMREWAGWVLDVTADRIPGVPRVARRAVKHWGRAVIGKTAAHGWRTIPLETLGGTGWDYRPAWNAELGAPSHLIDVCGQATETIATGDGDNAYPAILAWVESWTRVQLTRAIDYFGRGDVVACDTDGLIVTADRWERAGGTPCRFGPLLLREKGRYEQVRVIGPQHIVTPADTKMAGVPASAELGADGKLHALLWPKLAAQMALRPGNTEPGYLRPEQSYTAPVSTITGHVWESGRVTSLMADLCPYGETHLLPISPFSAFQPPSELQAKHLKSMLTPLPDRGQECISHSPRLNGITGVSNRSDPITSSGSFLNPVPPADVKQSRWRITGVISGLRARLASYGWTRT